MIIALLAYIIIITLVAWRLDTNAQEKRHTRWLHKRIESDVMRAIKDPLPYDINGCLVIERLIEKALDDGVKRGFLTKLKE